MHHKRTAPTEVGAIQQTHSTGYDLDYGHAAFMAATEQAYARGRRDASEDLARAWLHRDARMWTDMAVRNAAVHYGEEWALAIAEQAGA